MSTDSTEGFNDISFFDQIVPRVNIAAFCETASFANVIKDTSSDRRMRKTSVIVHMGGVQSALDFYSHQVTPNVLIVESQQNSSALFNELEVLSEVCDPDTKVIIAGPMNDVNLYRELIRQGVSEYILTPTSPIQIIETISDIFQNPETVPLGRVVCFAGAKGGAGTSTIAHNVAAIAATVLSIDTTLVDLDLEYGTANFSFGHDPAQTVLDTLRSPERIDEVMIERLVHKPVEKLKILYSPSTLRENTEFHIGAYETLLDSLRKNTDLVILDMPTCLRDTHKKLLTQADEIVLVTPSDIAGLRNVKSLFGYLLGARKNDTLPKVVVNQVGHPKKQEIELNAFEDALEKETDFVFPYDITAFSDNMMSGAMVFQSSKNQKLVTGLQRLTRSIAGRYVPQGDKADEDISPFTYLKKMLGQK